MAEPRDPVVRTLDRGLVLAVRTLPDSPVASAQLWFEAGAVDETDAEAGAAHFVEHMLFKGTTRRGVGEAAAEIEGGGGDLNAWTSWDETCFHATTEAGALSAALDVLFDMTAHSRLDPEELEREKQVVLEEIREYQEEPDAVASDRLHELLFDGHPYARPVIGWPRTVSSFDRPTVEGFWRKHYHPGRAILSVAGPSSADEVARWVQPWLAGWPDEGGATRAPIAVARPPAPGLYTERLKRSFGSVVVQLGFPCPGVGHPDLPALDVLVAALGQGAAARLPLLLDLDAGVASHVWADTQVQASGGALIAGFLCGETERAIEISVRELAAVARSGLAGTAVARARDGILADALFSTETAEGLAAELAWNLARTGDPRADHVYRAAISAVTPADVKRVAARWIDLERMRLVVIDQGMSERKIHAAVARGRKAKKPIRAAANGPVEHRVGRLRVVVAPDQSEVAAVRAIVVGGQLAENPETQGLSEAWARMVTRGAGRWNTEELAERCDALGAQLDPFVGRNVMGLQASFPSSNLVEAIEVFGEILVDPHHAAEDWDNVREELLDDLAAHADRGADVGSDALWRALWPNHPYRMPRLGTASTLQRLGPRRIARLHEDLITADNLVIAIAGGFDPDDVLEALAPFARDLPSKSKLAKRPRAGAPRAGAFRTVRAGREQATVLCGTRGLSIEHPDRAALTLACNLLDSQSGRLFLRLREERGLAYGVWARSETGVDGGVFSAGLSTDPARVDEARDALAVELRLLADEGPSEAEVERTRRMLIGLAAMRHQRVAGRSVDLAWCARFQQEYGLEALRARLATVDARAVRDVFRGLRLEDAQWITVLPEADPT